MYAILLFSHWKLENCFKLGIVIFSGRRKRKNFSYIVDGSCVFFFKHANLTQLCVSPPIQKILTCNRGFRRICRSFNNKTSLGKHSNGTQTITSSNRRVYRCPYFSRERVDSLGQRFLIFKKLGMTVQYLGPAALFQGKT